MKAVELRSFGVPHEVCGCVEVGDVGAPGDKQIVVDIEASPINPADLLIIRGKYPGPSELPARLGIEGTGRVVAVGKRVKDLKVGDRVISLGRTNWAQQIKLEAELAIQVPSDVDVLQVAMLKANPATAYLMLRDFVDLKRGDWVIQNAANSAVGRNLIRLAKARGLHTVNLVRRESLIERLREVGADVVLVDGPEICERVKTETGGAQVKLGFDAIGGEATMRMADCLDDGGTVVNYGFLCGQPCMLTPDQAILHGITLTGFWLVKSIREMSQGGIQILYEELCERIADGTFYVPIEATYGLDRTGDALAHAEREGRYGKVLFTPNGSIT
ncbi:MAG: zinc-dependent alcohol dehydrogenase family protein [Acidiferrobacterales bacterium]